MTIGIGVLASSEAGRSRGVIPDHLILVSDTMGSFGDEYSHPRLHKRFDLPENKAYILAANCIDRASELVPIIDRHLVTVPVEKRTYGDILRAVAMACFEYKMDRFIREVHPRHGIPPTVYDPLTASKEAIALLEPEWTKFDIETDLLVGAFSRSGQAHLIFVSSQDATAQSVSLPGFAAIGTGAANAMYWLAHRAHTLGMKPLRALYHAYEAKLMAEDAPNVNDEIDILVANTEHGWWCTSHTPLGETKQIPEFPIESLKDLFAKFGPRSTKELDKRAGDLVKRSVAQMSGGQQ